MRQRYGNLLTKEKYGQILDKKSDSRILKTFQKVNREENKSINKEEECMGQEEDDLEEKEICKVVKRMKKKSTWD